MTTFSTTTFDLTRDQLIRRALQVAQLLEASQTPSGDDVHLAADLLSMELDHLQAEHNVLRTITRQTLSLVDGTESYSLPSTAIDVTVDPDGKAGMVWSTTNSETVVRAISRQDYESITNKDTEGHPTLCYFEKGTTITAYFWPVPDESLTFRYSSVGFVTSLNRKWYKPILYGIAWQLALAKSKDAAIVGFLKKAADEAKLLAKGDDVQKGNAQLAIYRGWW